MRRRTPLLVVAALLALLVFPAAAAPTRVDALPTAAPFTRARFDFAVVAGGQPFAYGKGEFESATRMHLTLRSAPMQGMEEMTVEVVLYDGVTYTRENDSTQWYMEGGQPVESVPEVGMPTDMVGDVPADTPITLIGERDVAGTLTDQYQIWLGADETSFGTVDLFLGRQQAYLHKMQVTVYEDIEAPFATFGLDYRFYDFDSPAITVARPANAVERPSGQSVALPDGGLHAAAYSLSAITKAMR